MPWRQLTYLVISELKERSFEIQAALFGTVHIGLAELLLKNVLDDLIASVRFTKQDGQA